jgi:hypothetical protein
VFSLLRLVTVPALAFVVVGCSTGSTTGAPRTPTLVSSVPSTATAAPGFPGAEDGPVLDAARAFVQRVTSYDHTKLDDQLKGVLPLTGEPLKGELRKTLAADGEFAVAARANSRDALGVILDLGLVSREGNRAVVVVFVDQRVTSPAGESTQRLRERVTLGQARGSWLATKLETI